MVTINRAVDHLIDVLAGEDVPVVGSKATRVNQLADMIADGEIVIGGGGGYDLVISGTADESPHSWVLGDLSVASGSIEECERKCIAGEPVNAVLVLNTQFGETKYSTYVPLVAFDANYRALTFKFMHDTGSITTGTVWVIIYDSDYELIELLED